MKTNSSLTALNSLLAKALKLITKSTKEAAPAKAAESAAAR